MPEPLDWNCEIFVISPLSREQLARRVAELIKGERLIRQISHPLMEIMVHDNGYYPPDPDEPAQALSSAPHYLEIVPHDSSTWTEYLAAVQHLKLELDRAGYATEAVCSFERLLMSGSATARQR